MRVTETGLGSPIPDSIKTVSHNSSRTLGPLKKQLQTNAKAPGFRFLSGSYTRESHHGG